jgi:MFS transporter, ACS family, hexuronate transporter
VNDREERRRGDNSHSEGAVPQSYWRWWVCGVLLLATFLNYMDRQALAVTLPELKHGYNLAERRVGLVEGNFGFAFAAGSLFFGLLADRFGPRRLYPIVLIGWSLAGIATGFAAWPQLTGLLEVPGDEAGAGLFRWLLVWRTVLGFFEAGHWPCAFITVQRLMALKDRPLGNSILQSGAAFASILIPLYAEFIESQGWGWPVTFWSIGIAGLLWVPLWLVLVRRGDLDQGASSYEPRKAGAPRLTATFLRRLVVLAAIAASLTVSWQFLRAWLPLYLDFRGYDRLDLRIATAGYFASAEAGCIVGGILIKWLVSRGWVVHSARVLMFAVFTGLTAAAALVPLLGSGTLMIAGLMIAGAGILGLHPLLYSLSQDLSRPRMGLLSGALAFFGWIISSVFQILIGARIQQTKSYDVGLAIAGMAPLLGLIVLLALWKPERRGSGAAPRSGTSS